MTHYLAYGSNLNKEQMGARCPSAYPVGTGYINGYRLMYKGSMTGAYLTIEKSKGHKVPVAVWCVSKADERSLDRYEGHPVFYYRKNVTITVTKDDGTTEKLPCFVYIMREDRHLALPSRHYVDVCAEGYADFGFDIRYLDEAYGYTARTMRGCTVEWLDLTHKENKNGKEKAIQQNF